MYGGEEEYNLKSVRCSNNFDFSKEPDFPKRLYDLIIFYVDLHFIGSHKNETSESD